MSPAGEERSLHKPHYVYPGCGSPLVAPRTVMPPTEHRFHGACYRDDALFDVGGGCNAGRTASGSVKPGLTIAGYSSGCLPPPPIFMLLSYFSSG